MRAQSVSLYGELLEEVDGLKYLGSHVAKRGGVEGEKSSE